MASILETLTKQLAGSAMQQLSGQIGADRGTTAKATGATLSALIGALGRNASTDDGARALHNAVQKDHDGGNILDAIGSLVGKAGGGNPMGDAILGHILGGNRGAVETDIAQRTGLNSAATGKLLSTLAPLVMGALGKARQQNNLDRGGLAQMLNDERNELENQSKKSMGLLGNLMDRDGDGDVDLKDLAQSAGLLGKLLGR